MERRRVQAAELPPQSRAGDFVDALVIGLPFLALATAIVLLWNGLVGPVELGLMAGMYVLTFVGITVGFHRLFTHRSFETTRTLRYTFAVLGSMAIQGSIVKWVADHRKHHAFSDDDGDPHSPHAHGPGWRGTLTGFLHAHMGWLFSDHGRADPRRYAPELLEDRGMRLIDASSNALVAASLLIPFGLGFAIAGTLEGGLKGLLWGGLVRLFLAQHVTWCINSVCHIMGRRRFATEDMSRNVFWLAIPSMGESWHNNHHAFPRSASHGLRWWEVDLAGLVIRSLERLGLAWNVIRISPERQRQRLAGGPAPDALA